LKDNILPKGLVPLERIFNSNDVAVDSGKISQDEHIQDHNIGTQEKPRLVKLYGGVSPNFQERYINFSRIMLMSLHGPMKISKPMM